MTAPRLPYPYREEAAVVDALLASMTALDWSAVMATATPWVEGVRSSPAPFWAMESLLREYPITSAEGLALMRLAEALLRVPDAQTAIALTADQLGRADFSDAARGSDNIIRRHVDLHIIHSVVRKELGVGVELVAIPASFSVARFPPDPDLREPLNHEMIVADGAGA